MDGESKFLLKELYAKYTAYLDRLEGEISNAVGHYQEQERVIFKPTRFAFADFCQRWSSISSSPSMYASWCRRLSANEYDNKRNTICKALGIRLANAEAPPSKKTEVAA